MKVTIISPLYNEEKTIPIFFERFKKVLINEKKYSFEFAIIDDGSTDSSLAKILEIKKNYPHIIKVIRLSRNFGYSSALTAGLENIQSDLYILIDFDLEDPPEIVPQLLRKFEEGHEVVYTVKTRREDTPFRKICFNLFHFLFSRLTDIKIPEGSGSFSLMTKKFVSNLNRMGEVNRFIPGLRSYVGFTPAYISYVKEKRGAGQPKQTFFKLLRLALNAFFMYSNGPTYLSLLFLLLTLFIFIFNFNLNFVFIIFAAQLLMISSLLNRIHQQTLRRPNYIIENTYE